jgi:serine O-acetyltransferase
MGGAWRDFRADRARYSRTAWLTERSIWAVAAYRLAKASVAISFPLGPVLRAVSVPLTLLARIATNIEIPTSATIGPGLLIRHAGPIVIAQGTTIGRDCILITGVVLGTRGSEEAPVIGDRVRFGVYACVLGAVVVGDDAEIGALTLVTTDVPSRAVAKGVPARVSERSVRHAPA